MRQHTAKKVATLLEAVAITLQTHNRPRKRPGQPRHEAANVLGQRANVYSNSAAQFSLTGALKADTRTLGYSRYVRRQAEMRLLLATDTLPWQPYYATLTAFDNDERDTRLIARLCRSTANAVAKQHVTDEVMAEAA